ncbi:MAG: hypothetical protein GX683_06095 [Ruminococcaceae bacterium]|nr:hypothetical protein [Oscillospiraceae bacterium]
MENLYPGELTDVVVNAFLNEGDKRFDPNGSYTGTSTEEDETPVQDADDL